MQDEGPMKTVQLTTYEALVLSAKLPTLMRDAGRVGPTEYSALKSALSKIQAVS